MSTVFLWARLKRSHTDGQVGVESPCMGKGRISQSISRFGLLMILQLMVGLVFGSEGEQNQADVFEQYIAPLVIENCLECHRPKSASANLDLSTREGWVRGGDGGSVVDLDSVDDSYLLQRIGAHEMPPPVKGVPQQVPELEIQRLRNWIRSGMHWPDSRQLDLFEKTNTKRAGRDWWSLQPLAYSGHVEKESMASGDNLVDFFIDRMLLSKGLKPAPMASKETLIRRLYYSVIGLPPSSRAVQRFVDDENPEAWEDLVDDLLSRPQYGERWARLWLDVVRYADTSGYERDQEKPFAWKYRDWVVRSLNEDLDYSDFVRFQLAGDEYAPLEIDRVIATGFLRLGTWNDEPNDQSEYQYERLEDLVHTTSSAFLGLTIKCARCHTHKFDPISQDDYYRLASVFWNGPIESRDKKLLGGPSAEELGFDEVLGWTDVRFDAPTLSVFKNGDHRSPIRKVDMSTLSFVPSLLKEFEEPESHSSPLGYRKQLAEWIVDERNPLTWRVIVNRIWHHHFGQGLVQTPNNFGFLGEKPTHPELLDALSTFLLKNGGSLKSLHRLILLSKAWRRSVEHPEYEKNMELDPTNRWLWHAARRRLDAESLRDSMLSVAEKLDNRVGGPGFYGTISEQAIAGLSRKAAAWTPSSAEQQRRRSLYLFMKRGLMPPMMRTFDLCEANQSVGARTVTTVPTQALTLMNHQFVHARAQDVAALVDVENHSLQQRVAEIWQKVLRRSATEEEVQLGVRFVSQQEEEFLKRSGELIRDASYETLRGSASLHLAASEVTLDPVTGSVLMVRDRSGSGNLAVQRDAMHQPIVSESAWNGQPFLWFDGNKRFLHLEKPPIKNAISTVLLVISDEGGRGHREVLSNWRSGENVGTSFFIGLTAENQVRVTDVFANAGTVSDAKAPFVLSVVCDEDKVTVYQSGRKIATRETGLERRQMETPWVIGQQGNIQGEYWTGGIAEVLVFPRPLELVELRAVESALAERYGLELAHESTEDSPKRMALASLVRVLFNSNEFIYLD